MAKGILQNRDFITDYIRRNQPSSRFQIAREFQMNPSTVGNIVDGLIADGLIVETDETRPSGSAGRPPIMLRPNPDAGCFVGLDVYRDRVTGVVTDFAGCVVRVRDEALSRRPSRRAVEGCILRVVASLADERSGWSDRLKAIGIGLPGVVDREAGVALRYRPISDWENVPVRDWLEARVGVPAFIDHNSNTVALGEACLGDAAGHDHVVAVLMRTGVSIGVVRHRDIVPQSAKGAGELGHTVLRIKGRRCWCGARGCLEAYASGWALQKDVRRLLRTHPDWPGGAAVSGEVAPFDPGVICRLAAEGDVLARDLLSGMFHYLGMGVHTVVRLLAPEAVIVCGSFNGAADLMRREIGAVLEQPLEHPIRMPRLIVSSQDDRIGAAGAAMMAASMVCNPIHRVPN